MKDKVLAKLFEGFDKSLLSEEVQNEVSSLIDQMVQAKIATESKKIMEKEAKLKAWVEEQNNVLKEKEKVLEEVAKAFSDKCINESKQKEAIMMEAINEYVGLAESIAREEGTSLKEHLESIALEQCGEYKSYIEKITLEELNEHKISQEAVLARDVDKFKEKMVEKVGQFMDTRFEQTIPKDIMEAAVQAAAMKPIVEGIVKVFGKSYIQFDSTGHTAIKEAKAEAEKLTESLNAKIRDNVRLSARLKELEKANKLSSLLEGFTATQKDRAKVLLEKYETDELEGAFKKIKDVVIEQSVRKPAPQTVITESQKKQMQKIKESVDETGNSNLDPEMKSWVKDLNRNINS